MKAHGGEISARREATETVFAVRLPDNLHPPEHGVLTVRNRGAMRPIRPSPDSTTVLPHLRMRPGTVPILIRVVKQCR